MMQKILITAAAVLIGGAATWRLSTGDAAVEPTARSASSAETGPAGNEPPKRPRAVVPVVHYDFGVMNVGAHGGRKFTVRNEGEADLTLSLGGTSCQCTLAELKNGRLPPGQTTEIELTWDAAEETRRFRHGARINTNDPDLPAFDLVVEGRVLVEMGIHPTTVIFQGIPRRTTRTNHLLIYSQQTDDVRVRRVEATGRDIEVRLGDVDATTREALDAKWLRDVAVTINSGDKPGFIAENVLVYYTLGDSSEERMFKFGVAGEVVGDISLSGRDVADKLLLMGTVPRSAGRTKTAYLLVRGDDPQGVQFSVDSCKPAGLEATVGAAQKLSPTMTRYPVNVTARPDVPLGNYSSTASGLGEVVLKSTHPDYPTVRFDVSFVVTPD